MSIEHIYGQKLRDLQAENDKKSRKLNEVEKIIFNTDSKETVYGLIHKIKLALLKQ